MMQAVAFFPPSMLEIIYKAEDFIVDLLQFRTGGIRNTEYFERIIKYPAFDIFIFNTTDLHLSVYPFKGRRIVIVRQVAHRNLHRDQLRRIVVLVV